ncbi:hypothetical protein [Rhizobium leguminosarum]|jgi:hypothetical protein|uniref:hypothetical protein n=1 Tax=Rhizobium leguminosarum TaxID=384 RepID=UPI002E15B02F|nr:hypothetical protein U8Q02_42705 [Rhizobium leguminosarum]
MTEIKFPVTARVLAVAVCAAMGLASVAAVVEARHDRSELVGRVLTLPDGRSARTLHLLDDDAAVEASGADGGLEGWKLPQAAESQSE